MYLKKNYKAMLRALNPSLCILLRRLFGQRQTVHGQIFSRTTRTIQFYFQAKKSTRRKKMDDKFTRKPRYRLGRWGQIPSVSGSKSTLEILTLSRWSTMLSSSRWIPFLSAMEESIYGPAREFRYQLWNFDSQDEAWVLFTHYLLQRS